GRSWGGVGRRESERIGTPTPDLPAFPPPTPADREPADLNEITSQIVRLLEPEARKRDVGITMALAERVPVVVVHEAQVKQVLMNIVLKAIQACGTHGAVHACTAADATAGSALDVQD